MRRQTRLSLVELFLVATLALAGAVGATFYTFLDSSRQEILARSDTLREAAARHVDERVTAQLKIPLETLGDVERGLKLGVLRGDDPDELEARLFTELVDHPSLAELSFTHADLQGFGADHQARIGPDDRWQVAVFRTSADPDSAIVTRRIAKQDGHLVAQLRRRPPGGGLLSAPFEPGPAVTDPTGHPTFVTTVSERSYGGAIWSDLAWTEHDQALPKKHQRVVVTVQKAVEDTPAHFVGVVRVGLLAATIDALPRMAQGDDSSDSPQRVILCDAEGRLVARLEAGDSVEVNKDDLRVAPSHMPPEVAAALAIMPRSEPVEVNGTRYLVTFRKLETSQDWSVGVIVPEDYYTRDLRALRDRFLWTFLSAVAIVLVVGGLVMRLLRRSLGRIVDTTAHLRSFDFSPVPTEAPLREIADVMEGVERAKTSMRVLGKYASVDLVRRLFESNVEPHLGGEIMEISLLFTDIQGFTSLSEKLSPDALAHALGAYLETMTRAIQGTGGTIDKFIGDAVMAFWNAPTPQADHAHRACRATLACLAATRELYASEAWKGLPPLFTRYGLHCGRVMVGHFGAPERFNYTAMGDGVNLAARLEPLCKQYGVGVLASEAIVEQARDEFEFRLVDRVAVKGKDESVQVYELLGARGQCDDAVKRARVYEQALQAYVARDFAGARGLLVTLPDDPPSRVLVERCETMTAHPPPEGWNGVYVAKSK
jgi:adenylate cyclase